MGGVIIKLIICGNGLDIHVGLNTSYRAYRDYLVNKKIYEGESAISIIEKSDFFIPRDKDCWTDLENALTFDYRKYNSGGAQPKLNQATCRAIIMNIPCLEEQQKIADCLSSLDEVIKKQKATLAAWEELKKGLLQQMFV